MPMVGLPNSVYRRALRATTTGSGRSGTQAVPPVIIPLASSQVFQYHVPGPSPRLVPSPFFAMWSAISASLGPMAS